MLRVICNRNSIRRPVVTRFVFSDSIQTWVIRMMNGRVRVWMDRDKSSVSDVSYELAGK